MNSISGSDSLVNQEAGRWRKTGFLIEVMEFLSWALGRPTSSGPLMTCSEAEAISRVAPFDQVPGRGESLSVVRSCAATGETLVCRVDESLGFVAETSKSKVRPWSVFAGIGAGPSSPIPSRFPTHLQEVRRGW